MADEIVRAVVGEVDHNRIFDQPVFFQLLDYIANEVVILADRIVVLRYDFSVELVLWVVGWNRD